MKGIFGYQKALGDVKNLTMERLWTWSKLYGLDAYGGAYFGLDKCIDFLK